ncbi:type 1 glutamine amidotransferase [Lentilactobacillus laojiaonis]|uniref:type 1 glutamine amidotransferase n=1 Tax=Lentilactobacillus laojiaonis TaxID=2883998 RepID=UPI001D0AC39C|nr:glutamine amidotransferase [Lentilactobacillus laojiaonis]UDM31769.1 glutamine amidotransferase [Lentilactobacillus laojiaonis]
MKYSLKVAHLYGDLMNPYGDMGNVLVLKYLGAKMDIDISAEVVSLDQPFNADDYDIAVFGGGQDFEQSIVSKDIQNKKTELTRFIENDKSLLAICGGYQLLGHYYVDAENNKLPGIGALDHYTEKQENHRFIGDIIIENEETGEQYHGFENHQGMTYLGKGERPLGKVLQGNGNNGSDQSEGVIYKHTYGTYFHGPILARNPQIAKHLLINALQKKYPDTDFTEQNNLVVEETF